MATPAHDPIARVNLEIDRHADPISGRLTLPHGRWLAFTGWLGLARALQDALAPQSPPAASASLPTTSTPRGS